MRAVRGAGAPESVQVYFEPGVLVAAEDYGGFVHVEEEDGGVGRGLGEEVVFY